MGVDRGSELLSSLATFPRAAWEDPDEPGPASRSRSRAFSLSCCCFFDLNKKAMAGGGPRRALGEARVVEVLLESA